MDNFLHSHQQVTCNLQCCRRELDILINGGQAMAVEPSKSLPLPASLQKIPDADTCSLDSSHLRTI